MKKLNFTKMVAAGNDFVIIDTGRRPIIKKLCDRKYGIGADGVLLLEKSKKADIKMRVFNADGSEAEMCGNGARCAALYSSQGSAVRGQVRIETQAGIIEAEVKGDNVKIKLTDPKDIKLDIPVKINSRPIKVNFINTGVPHIVVFVEGLDKIDVVSLGRQIRRYKAFAPAGANVNFVELISSNSIRIRTYERGVEGETFACGTGSAASALLSAIYYPLSADKINIHTQGGEILKIYFKRAGGDFRDVWLEGRARIAYKGEYYV